MNNNDVSVRGVDNRQSQIWPKWRVTVTALTAVGILKTVTQMMV